MKKILILLSLLMTGCSTSTGYLHISDPDTGTDRGQDFICQRIELEYKRASIEGGPCFQTAPSSNWMASIGAWYRW